VSNDDDDEEEDDDDVGEIPTDAVSKNESVLRN